MASVEYAKLQRMLFRFGAGPAAIEKGAIYVNVSQYLFAHPENFARLDRRRDVRAVFMLHDLLPLDYPEFFSHGEAARFARRVDMVFSRAVGIIVTSGALRQRVAYELSRRGRAPLPILVNPLPSPLAGIDPQRLFNSELAAAGYFVMVATIEPRKNHLLILNIRRQMAERAEKDGSAVPRLLLVGKRWAGKANRCSIC